LGAGWWGIMTTTCWESWATVRRMASGAGGPGRGGGGKKGEVPVDDGGKAVCDVACVCGVPMTVHRNLVCRHSDWIRLGIRALVGHIPRIREWTQRLCVLSRLVD